MIRKTIYERLFDQLTDDPRIKDAEPTPRPQRRQHHLHAGRRRMVLHCQGKTPPRRMSPVGGRHLQHAGRGQHHARHTRPADLGQAGRRPPAHGRRHGTGGQVMSANNKELPAILTIADTMAYLSCSRQHIYDLLNAGRIRTYKIGRRRYIDADSLAHLFWS